MLECPFRYKITGLFTFRSFYGSSRRKQEARHFIPLSNANESDVDESSDEELDYDCDIDYVGSDTEEETIESDESTGEVESDSGQEEHEDSSANENQAKNQKTKQTCSCLFTVLVFDAGSGLTVSLSTFSAWLL